MPRRGTIPNRHGQEAARRSGRGGARGRRLRPTERPPPPSWPTTAPRPAGAARSCRRAHARSRPASCMPLNTSADSSTTASSTSVRSSIVAVGASTSTTPIASPSVASGKIPSETPTDPVPGRCNGVRASGTTLLRRSACDRARAVLPALAHDNPKPSRGVGQRRCELVADSPPAAARSSIAHRMPPTASQLRPRRTLWQRARSTARSSCQAVGRARFRCYASGGCLQLAGVRKNRTRSAFPCKPFGGENLTRSTDLGQPCPTYPRSSRARRRTTTHPGRSRRPVRARALAARGSVNHRRGHARSSQPRGQRFRSSGPSDPGRCRGAAHGQVNAASRLRKVTEDMDAGNPRRALSHRIRSPCHGTTPARSWVVSVDLSQRSVGRSPARAAPPGE